MGAIMDIFSPSEPEQPAAPEVDTGSLWDSYQQEKMAAREQRDADLAQARARLAAGGARPGSGAWTAAETRVTDAYTKAIESLTSSTAVKTLMEQAGVGDTDAMEKHYGGQHGYREGFEEVEDPTQRKQQASWTGGAGFFTGG